MSEKCCQSLVISLIIFTAVVYIDAIHVVGQWSTKHRRVKVVTKFGFQQTVALDRANSRGFVFGNVTARGFDNTTRPVLFALVPHTHINSFHSNSQYGESCALMMENLTNLGFESRCFTDGIRGDIFRWIPCIEGQLCKDEDDPHVVIPDYQMTIQIEEPLMAEYWYIVLIACDLDSSCNWTRSESYLIIDYDLWLTNGKPGSSAVGPFTLQFSFDEQDSLEMYFITLILYMVLFGILSKGQRLVKHCAIPDRLRLLACIVTLKTVGVALQSFNVFVFALDGKGIFIARIFGEILRIVATQLLCLLLILLARGWGFYARQDSLSKCCIVMWSILTAASLILFFCNFIFVYDVLHEIDVFTSWPGYGQLIIRMFFALTFLTEIRQLILREQSEERATFLAHIGAGFLVWFVYLPGLGVIASFISQLWRFKIILGITTFANYTAIACLVHLFWPTSSYRKFFQDDLNQHRRMGRTDSNELHDYERFLFESDDSDADFPEIDHPVNLHTI